MPLWALLEVVSFGTLIGMMKFCADRWGDPDLKELHYQLKRVKSIRNATGQFLLLPQRHRRQEAGEHPRSVGYFEGTSQMGLPKKLRARKLRNARMQQVVSLLYLYSVLVPDGGSRTRALAALRKFYETADENMGACLPPTPSGPPLPSWTFDKRIQTARLASHSKTIWFYGRDCESGSAPVFLPRSNASIQGKRFFRLWRLHGLLSANASNTPEQITMRSTECPAPRTK